MQKRKLFIYKGVVSLFSWLHLHSLCFHVLPLIRNSELTLRKWLDTVLALKVIPVYFYEQMAQCRVQSEVIATVDY